MRCSGFLNRGDAFQTGVTTSFTLGERNVRDTGTPGVIPPNAVLVLEIGASFDWLTTASNNRTRYVPRASVSSTAPGT